MEARPGVRSVAKPILMLDLDGRGNSAVTTTLSQTSGSRGGKYTERRVESVSMTQILFAI